jgi:signal transduction histidine kinase
MHEDLEQQLRSLGIGLQAPPSAEAWQSFLAQVSSRYFETGVRERAETRTAPDTADMFASLGRLVPGIAHELNTPIQFVGDNVTFLTGAFEQLTALCETYRGLCEQTASGPLSAADIERKNAAEETAEIAFLRENVPAALTATSEGLERVSQIVQSMKVFGHIDRGAKGAVDVNSSLRHTLTVATNLLKYVADVETEFGDIPAVSGVASDINYVFLTLVARAGRAIADAVGRSGKRGRLTVQTQVDGDSVVISFRDTGPGISPAVRDTIFAPSAAGSSDGLGHVHAIVVEHGGTVSVDSETDGGSTFYVRLPALTTEPDGL